jgi:hypothetical protein
MGIITTQPELIALSQNAISKYRVAIETAFKDPAKAKEQMKEGIQFCEHAQQELARTPMMEPLKGLATLGVMDWASVANALAQKREAKKSGPRV